MGRKESNQTKTQRAALRWTNWILYVYAAVYGVQTVKAYSKCGLMRVLYAVDFSSCLCGLVFLLRKPNV